MTDTPEPVPGLELLGYGYDAFASAYCDESARKGDGRGDPLLTDLDGSSPAAKTVSVLGGHYLCPPIVKVLSQQVLNSDYTTYADTSEEYTRKLSVAAGVSASIGGFAGSIETNYSSSTHSYLDNVYGEHGHVYSGIKVLIPLSPHELRASLKPDVAASLQKLSAAEAIATYGTHLVTGVVIGGKAFMRQYATRSEVSNATQWQAAVKASYDGVTASSSVDSQYSSVLKSFRMSQDVQMLGGIGNVIGAGGAKTADQFQAWLQSVNGNPAIIDITATVPLWQLLPLGSEARDRLKRGIITYARTFQAGAILGARTDYTDERERDPFKPGQAWGSTIGRPLIAAGGHVWNPFSSAMGWGSTSVFLTTGLESRDVRRWAIYGGQQTNSNAASTDPFVQSFQWGTDRNSRGKLTEMPLWSGFADKGRGTGGTGYSNVTIYVGPIEEAEGRCYVLRAAKASFDDGTVYPWSLPGVDSQTPLTEQKICRAEMWDQQSGWSMCTIIWMLQPVLTGLNELGGDTA